MKILQSHRGVGIGWFRVFGVGLIWKDLARHDLLFSERNRLVWGVIRLGRWYVRFLPYLKNI